MIFKVLYKYTFPSQKQNLCFFEALLGWQLVKIISPQQSLFQRGLFCSSSHTWARGANVAVRSRGSRKNRVEDCP